MNLKWFLWGALGLALLIGLGILLWRLGQPVVSPQDPAPHFIQEIQNTPTAEEVPPQTLPGGEKIGETALSLQEHAPKIGSLVKGKAADVVVSGFQLDEDQKWGRQATVSLSLVGRAATAQPLARMIRFFLEDEGGRWVPATGRDLRWQEILVLPGQPLRFPLTFRGIGTGDKNLMIEMSGETFAVALKGKEMQPVLPPFRCETNAGAMPLDVQIRRAWTIHSSPVAQPLAEHRFLVLEMVLRPREGYAPPQIQLWNVLLADREGKQYPATPYAVPVNEELSVWGKIDAERRMLVGFEVPFKVSPHCLVIFIEGSPVYASLQN